MSHINYNNRKFRPQTSSANSQVSSHTIFHYQQQDNILWATYQGGAIERGHLIGLVASDGTIEMRYHHIDNQGQLRTGVCRSQPELLNNGKLLLHESWQWTSGDSSKGVSVLEEI